METLSSVADVLDSIARGQVENVHALQAASHLPYLEDRHKICVRRWLNGVATSKDVTCLHRVAMRLRELDPEYGVTEMIVKERYGVQLANGKLARNEENDSPHTFTTQRAAKKVYGESANIVSVRCSYEVVAKAKGGGK
jgi:thiamine kinase-like enzyme